MKIQPLPIPMIPQYSCQKSILYNTTTLDNSFIGLKNIRGTFLYQRKMKLKKKKRERDRTTSALINTLHNGNLINSA